jgi:CheY-like chemotaxis protein
VLAGCDLAVVRPGVRLTFILRLHTIGWKRHITHCSETTMNSSLKFLVVNDNETARSAVANAIKRIAREIRECSDGVEALGEYGVFLPDWVLMNATMKKMDGLTATSLIRQYYPKAKVMLIAEDDSPAIQEKAKQAGAAALIGENSLADIPGFIGSWRGMNSLNA